MNIITNTRSESLDSLTNAALHHSSDSLVAADADGPSAGPPSTTALFGLPAIEAQAVPAVLQQFRQQYNTQELMRHFRPANPLETALVQELAYHLSALEIWNQSLTSTMRRQAGIVAGLVPSAADGGAAEPDEDLALAALFGPAVQAAEQNCQKRSRAFHRTLQVLLDLRRPRGFSAPACPPQKTEDDFSTEQACEEYLLKRFQQGRVRCANCQGGEGYYVPSRRVWECRNCSRQAGLRAGTVAADSSLPLKTWFAAIKLLLQAPHIGTRALSEKLAIKRLATVRKLAKKIRAAMAAADAEQRLAGLREHFSCGPPAAPELSAPFAKNISAQTALARQSLAEANRLHLGLCDAG